ncbi:MAG: hypothetical protein V4732_14895 [Pseudomonadota bacterium]
MFNISILILAFVLLQTCSNTIKLAEKIEPEKVHLKQFNYYYAEKNKKVKVYDYHGVLEETTLPQCDSPLLCGNVVYISCVGGQLSIHEYYNNINGMLVQDCSEPCINGVILPNQKCERKCPPREWQCEKL